jgi:Phosphoesterase family
LSSQDRHHGFDHYFGAMNRWVQAKGPFTMGYFTQADIPFQWALAEAFTVCDHYFCSVFGPTNPNRLYMWTGMIDPGGTGGPRHRQQPRPRQRHRVLDHLPGAAAAGRGQLAASDRAPGRRHETRDPARPDALKCRFHGVARP